MTRAIIIDSFGNVEEVSDREFFNRLFPKPNPQEHEEKAQAFADKRAAVQAVYRSAGTATEHLAKIAVIQSAYEARLREIEARYAEQLTEVEHLGPGRIAA
jgi:hypothetical protein